MFRPTAHSHISNRRFGARTLTSVALSSLFVGLLVASGLQGTNVSVAQGFGQSATLAARHGNGARLFRRIGRAAWPDSGEYSGDQDRTSGRHPRHAGS